MELSNIKEILSIVKELGVVQHLVALKDFYFHPKQFWRAYSYLSVKEKTIQFLLYFAIFVCIVSVFNGYTIDNISKLSIPLTSLAIINIVLIIGFYLSKANEVRTRDIVVFGCYSLFLLFPIALIFWTTYEITGNYHILFLHNIVYVLLDLYLWFAPVFIFIPKWKNRILTLVSVFVLLNIAEVFIYPMRNNDSTYFHNYIQEERYELGKTISNAYIIPYCVVSNKNNTETFYLYTESTDSIAKDKVDTKPYFDDLAKDMNLLRTMSEKCKYDQNKIFFSRLFEIRRGIIHCHQNRQYSNIITKETIIADADGTELDRYTYRLFNEDIIEMNNQLLEMDIRDAEAYELALSPLIVTMWIRPALMLAIKYDNNN